MDASVEDLQKKLTEAIALLREAIEMSVELKAKQPDSNYSHLLVFML